MKVFNSWANVVPENADVERIIYVIDDDPGVRKSTSVYFRSLGYRHWPYANGADFLDHIDQSKPGCVLLDLRMPFVSGLEVLAKLYDRRSQFPTIVVTGHGDVETAVKAMKLGAIDFLEKPFEEAVVLAAVENAFASIDRAEAGPPHALDAQHLGQVLTPRQLQVLAGLVEGLSNKAIAMEMRIAPRTVEMHRANLMQKLNAKSLAEVVKMAIPLGLPPLTGSKNFH